jgi:hypothetical protein
MKKLTTILLLLLSLISYSQDYYRDTLIERAIFNEVNRHRDSLGIDRVKFNPDNKKAISWGELLVNHDLESGGVIYHCGCTPGVEIIAIQVIGDENVITKGVDEIASLVVLAWNNSPSHKKGMENINMKRGFNAVYVFKSERFNGRYVALSVYQFLRDKDYYTQLDWDENERVRNKFLVTQ